MKSIRHFSTRARLAVGATSLALLALLTSIAWQRSHRTNDERGPAPSLHVAWATATEYRYAFSLVGSSRSLMTPASEGATATQGAVQFDVAGKLVARSYGVDAGVTIVGLSLGDTSRRSVVMMGQELLDSDEHVRTALAGEVIVEIDARGNVRGMRTREGAGGVWEQLARVFVAELSIGTPAAPAWQWAQPAQTIFGATDDDYEITSSTTLRRHHAHYGHVDALPGLTLARYRQDLDQRAEIEVGSGGELRGIHEHERLALIGDASDPDPLSAALDLSLTFVSKRALGAPMPRELSAAWIEASVEPTGHDEADRRTWEKRANGLSLSALEDVVRQFAFGGALDDKKSVWQATGLLKLHPEYCDELVELALEAGMTDRGRGLILDVLASADTVASQRAMRDLLSAPTIAGGPKFADLVVRTSFILHPTPETVAFLVATYDRKTDDSRSATARSLGALSGRLARRPGADGAAGLAAHQHLVDALDRSTDPKEAHALLIALGNAGLPSAVPSIVARASDDSASVRDAAARALRKQSGPEVERALRALSCDATSEVAETAIRSIGERPGAAAVTGLVDEVTAGHTLESTDDAAIEVLRHHLRDAPGATGALLAIAARHPDDLALQARVRTLLTGGTGAS